MPVSPGSEIGQEAGLVTPLLSLRDALVSPATYFLHSRWHPESYLHPQILIHVDSLTVGNYSHCWSTLKMYRLID